MDIWVINLAQDVERLAFMKAQLDGFDLPFQRAEAVYGARAEGDEAAFRDDPRRAHLSPAEAGCSMSHIRVWRTVAAGGSDFALILEDDVHFAPDFGEFFRGLRLDPQELCIHRLETFLARVTTLNRPAMQVGRRRAFRLLTNHGGAAAYILNRKTAARLVACADDVFHPPDIALFDPERRIAPEVAIYQWTPAPCIQDMHLRKGGGAGFTSHLAPDRYDQRAGILRQETGLMKALKDVVRPLYTSAYAAALAPKGRTRMFVGFG